MTLASLLFAAPALAAPPPPPPPPYLDRGAVQAALVPVPEAVSGCVPADAPAGLVRVGVRLHGEGRVEVLSVTGAPGDPACWTAALGAQPGPKHAGAPVEAGFGLPVAAGAVGTALELRLQVPTPDPLFLHVPASLSAAERAALVGALGLAGDAP